MHKATVSSDFTLEIPEEVRAEIPIVVGQTLDMVVHGEVISLVPERPLAELRGFLKGMNVDDVRDKQDRF